MTASQYAVKEKELFRNEEIPVELQGVISYLAYEQGHACGCDETWGHLTDMVYNLSEPLKQYTKRIKRN